MRFIRSFKNVHVNAPYFLMSFPLLFCFAYRHDVAEVAGLTSFSFGEMEVNRFIILFKKVSFKNV